MFCEYGASDVYGSVEGRRGGVAVQVVAQVPRASARQSSAILSSIEFDRDAQLFATAGVSKRICVFNFADVVSSPLPLHSKIDKAIVCNLPHLTGCACSAKVSRP